MVVVFFLSLVLSEVTSRGERDKRMDKGRGDSPTINRALVMEVQVNRTWFRSCSLPDDVLSPRNILCHRLASVLDRISTAVVINSNVCMSLKKAMMIS